MENSLTLLCKNKKHIKANFTYLITQPGTLDKKATFIWAIIPHFYSIFRQKNIVLNMTFVQMFKENA